MTRLLPLTLAFLLPLSAMAQTSEPQCSDRAGLRAHLAMEYGEIRQFVGLATNNVLLEMFASPETRSWTITGTNPGGEMCLLASGFAFELTVGETPR